MKKIGHKQFLHSAELRRHLALAASEGCFPDPRPGPVLLELDDGTSVVVDSDLLSENLRDALAAHSLSGTAMPADPSVFEALLLASASDQSEKPQHRVCVSACQPQSTVRPRMPA